MKCPACDTDLRVDGFVRNDGVVVVEVSCQNDAERTDKCIPVVSAYLKLEEESDGWRLR